MTLSYTYEECVRASERVAWTLDDVLPKGVRLSFDKPYLPESMVSSAKRFDDPAARLAVNHVTAHSYLNLFGFVEEYIIAVAIEHAVAEVFGDAHALRALARTADEELKHQQLFERFRDAFRRDYVEECGVIDRAIEVAGRIMSKSPIAVMLATLHLELTTQRHYVGAARERGKLDARFTSLLHHHWLEEAQHSKVEALQLIGVLGSATDSMREQAAADYVDILAGLDDLLGQQALLDASSMRSIAGARVDVDAVAAAQHESYRDLFITAGLENREQQQLVRLACGSDDAIVAARAARPARSARSAREQARAG